MKISESIHNKLSQAFQPEKLEIIDESAPHKGHSGYDEGGESHLLIKISAKPFESMNRIERQRAIFKTIEEEVKIVHAFNFQFV